MAQASFRNAGPAQERLRSAGSRPPCSPPRVSVPLVRPQGGGMETPYAFVARIEAKSDRAEDVAALLTGALPLAQAEPGTVTWYAARTSPTTFWIFDTFGSEDARQAHINGEIAAALMANADELLAGPPEILAADVLASK